MRKLAHTKKGFTLVEMIVSVGLFAIVMVVATGAILTIITTNKTAQSLNSVITNLNFAIESMLRDLRTGSNYQCGAVRLNQSLPISDCTTGGSSIGFQASDGSFARYYFESESIKKEYQDFDQTTGQLVDTPDIAVTAPEVHIDALNFFVVGTQSASAGNLIQPKVLVQIKGHAGEGKYRSDFNIQSLVSERVLDI